MCKIFHFVVFFVILSIGIYGQERASLDSLWDELQLASNVEERNEIYLSLSDYYKKAFAADSLFYYASKVLESGDILKKAEANNYIGISYLFKNQSNKSIPFFITSRELFRSNKKKTLKPINNLYLAYSLLANFDSALFYSKEQLLIAEQINDSHELFDAFNNLGSVYYYKNSYADAIESYQKALTYAQKTGDNIKEADALGNIGIVYSDVGLLEKSIKFSLKSAFIFQKKNQKRKLATVYNNVGTLFFDLGNLTEAEKYYLKALEIEEALPLRMEYATVLMNLGLVYGNKNDSINNKIYLLKAEKIAEKIEYISILPIIDTNLGNHHLNFTKDLDSAVYYYDKSFELNNKLGQPQNALTALINKCTALIRSRNINDLENTLLKAEELAESINLLVNFKTLAQAWSKYYELKGDYKQAYKHYVAYKVFADSLINEEKLNTIGRIEGKYQLQIELDEKKRIEEEKARKLQEEINRNRSFQIRMIGIGILVIFLALVSLRLINISEKAARVIVLVFSLLLFEFLLVTFDSYIENASQNSVTIKLALNSLIAFTILPINRVFEKGMKRVITSRR